MKTRLILLFLLIPILVFGQKPSTLEEQYDTVKQIRNGKFIKTFSRGDTAHFGTNQKAFDFSSVIFSKGLYVVNPAGASAIYGSASLGVQGNTISGTGVLGSASGTGYGVNGVSSAGIGVYGIGTTGVYGLSSTGNAGHFKNNVGNNSNIVLFDSSSITKSAIDIHGNYLLAKNHTGTITDTFITKKEARSLVGMYAESDPTVYTWAKASTKPSYTSSDIGLGNVTNNAQWYSGNHPTTISGYGITDSPNTPVADIFNWSTNKYTPYATQQAFLSFDNSSTDPTLTGRLNLNGSLYVTSLSAFNGGSTYGVAGLATSGIGLSGQATSGKAVLGRSTTGTSFYGQQTDPASNYGNMIYLSRTGTITGNITSDIMSIIDNPTVSGTNFSSVLKATIGSTVRIDMNPRVLRGNYLFDTNSAINDTASIVIIGNYGVTKHKFKGNGDFYASGNVYANGTLLGGAAPILTLGSIPYSNGTTFTEDNANLFFDATNHQLGVGTNTFLATGNVINAKASSATSVQMNVQNTSNGTSSSSDLVATADNGDNSTNYVDVGINSSAYSDAAYNIGGPLTSYLSAQGGDLTVGTQTASKVIKFHTGGTTTSNLRATISDTKATFLGNILAPNIIQGYTTTVTAAGTTVLTVTSTYNQFFTGTTTQTVTLPDVTTLTLGHGYHIVNNSTGIVTINSSGANAVTTLTAGADAYLTCVLITGTTAASWNAFRDLPTLATGTTGTTTTNLVYSTSPTLVTPILGAATATSINKVTITAPTTSATLTLITGSTLATAGAYSTTLTATGTTNVTLPTGGSLQTGSAASALSAGSTITWTPVLQTNNWTLNVGANATTTINMGTIPASCVGQTVHLDITTTTTSCTITFGTSLKSQSTLVTGTTTGKIFHMTFFIVSTSQVSECSRTTAM